MTIQSNSNLEFKSLADDIANPVTHTALDFFEKPSVLINYESGHDQEVFPQTGPRGPTLDFVISGDQRNCIDMNYIHLAVQAAIYKPNGQEKIDYSYGEPVVFTNNTLHSLFSQIEIYLNGILVADSNNTYHHRAFLETELTTNSDSKDSWTICQGYEFDSAIADGDKGRWFTDRLKKTLNKNYTTDLYGALYVDFFTCEKLLIPEVELRIKLYRASNEFSLIAQDNKMYAAIIEKGSLFVRKITLTESVRLSIERTLTKAPARYPYIESLCKSFIIQAGQNSFIKESIFGTEPIRRLTLCMVPNAQFRGSYSTNPFDYQKFDLKRIEIVRGNGLPNAGTPIDTEDNTRLYYNTMTALGFKNGGNKISLDGFENKYMSTFDLTSSQEASKNLTLFPELTGAPITLKLLFSKALPEAVEIFLIGERFSQVFIDSSRNIAKNQTLLHG